MTKISGDRPSSSPPLPHGNTPTEAPHTVQGNSVSSAINPHPTPYHPETPLFKRLMLWVSKNIPIANMGLKIGVFLKKRASSPLRQEISEIFPKDMSFETKVPDLNNPGDYISQSKTFEGALEEQIRFVKPNEKQKFLDDAYCRDCSRSAFAFGDGAPVKKTAEEAQKDLVDFVKKHTPQDNAAPSDLTFQASFLSQYTEKEQNFLLNLSALLSQITTATLLLALDSRAKSAPQGSSAFSGFLDGEQAFSNFEIKKEGSEVVISVKHTKKPFLAFTGEAIKQLEPEKSEVTFHLVYSVPINQLTSNLQGKNTDGTFENPMTITLQKDPSITGHVVFADEKQTNSG